jgi:hypothetical protein
MVFQGIYGLLKNLPRSKSLILRPSTEKKYKGCGAFSEWIYEEDGKVYQYINQKSYLLYDFKAKAGDSWKIIFFTSISNRVDSALVRVDSVSTINTASGMKKVQYVSGVKVPNTIKYDGNIGRYIIEGIGFNDYLFPSFGLCDAAPRGVRCYSENGITENFVNYDCNKTINWLDNKEQDATSVLSVSPNPSTGNLVVQMNELPSNTATWQLYDLQGKQVFLQLLQSNNTSFDLPDFLPQGIYFWRVMDGQEKLAQGKLVMTH